VAVSADGSTVYVAVATAPTGTGIVSVIAATNNTLTTTIPVGGFPLGVAVSPDGSTVYVTNSEDGTVSVIAAASNTVTATIPVGGGPEGVAVSPDGSAVYVANFGANTVSVIDTASKAVTKTITGFSGPVAFGAFIGPAPKFAGTPGFSNCHGVSVSALSIQYGGLSAAAKALGFPSVQALQNAIKTFCRG
jgi:YVTN family beta-propeller protein